MGVTLTADMPIQITSDLRQRIQRGGRLVQVRQLPVRMFLTIDEERCQTNHSQTLDRIRQRGGFDAAEAVAVLTNLHWRDVEGLSEILAHRILYRMVAAFNRGGLIERQTTLKDKEA